MVAEGVETEDRVRALQVYGCDMAPGYLFSQPLPEWDLLVWVPDRDANRFDFCDQIKSQTICVG